MDAHFVSLLKLVFILLFQRLWFWLVKGDTLEECGKKTTNFYHWLAQKKNQAESGV